MLTKTDQSDILRT